MINNLITLTSVLITFKCFAFLIIRSCNLIISYIILYYYYIIYYIYYIILYWLSQHKQHFLEVENGNEFNKNLPTNCKTINSSIIKRESWSTIQKKGCKYMYTQEIVCIWVIHIWIFKDLILVWERGGQQFFVCNHWGYFCCWKLEMSRKMDIQEEWEKCPFVELLPQLWIFRH